MCYMQYLKKATFFQETCLIMAETPVCAKRLKSIKDICASQIHQKYAKSNYSFKLYICLRTTVLTMLFCVV